MGAPIATSSNPLEQFGRTIGLLYEAALDGDYWPHAVESLRILLCGSSALLFMPATGPDGLWVGQALDSESIASYQAHYHALDLWLSSIKKQRIPSDAVIVGDDVVPAPLLLQSEWYNDFLKRYDLFHLMTSQLTRPSQAFSATILSFYRDRSADRFDDVDRRLYARVIPHLRRALEVRARLTGAVNIGADAVAAVERLAQPVLLLDRQSRAVFLNPGAEAVIGQKDGLGLEHDRLVASDAVSQRDLARAIQDAVAGQIKSPVPAMVRRPSGKRAYMILVVPLPVHRRRRAVALLLIGDVTMARDGAVTRLGHLYGLTSAEIAVMGAIVSGFSIQEIADLRHVSVNTIRQQLKELLAKTGSHRQTDLVRLALSVPALADDGGC